MLLILLLIIACVTISLARYPVFYLSTIKKHAKAYEVEPSLVASVINVESSFNPSAKSKKGAVGLMQLMPKTAEWCALRLGIEYDESLLFEPDYNVRIGTYYLKYLLDKFGDERLALCAYNAGEGNVKKWQDSNLNIAPFPETERYVKKVAFAKRIYLLRIN